jgi:hypothetical protein
VAPETGPTRCILGVPENDLVNGLLFDGGSEKSALQNKIPIILRIAHHNLISKKPLIFWSILPIAAEL